jgi:hypothetical protein
MTSLLYSVEWVKKQKREKHNKRPIIRSLIIRPIYTPKLKPAN